MTRSSPMLFALFLVFGAPITLAASQASAQTTASSEAIDTEAHALFEAGRSAYSDGRFDDALGYFRRAYELSHRPQLLYNIGQCQDRLRHDTEALAVFEEFLVALPDAPQRAEVTARIQILRASLRQADTTATTTTTTTTEPGTPEMSVTIDDTSGEGAAPVVQTASDPSPWIVLGTGGALAIVGAILLGVGYADIAAIEGAMNVPFSSVRAGYDQAPALTGAGWGLLGVGVALAGVGLVWGLSGGGGSSEHARLRLGPTGISVSGSF